jgi:hypothetical protein
MVIARYQQYVILLLATVVGCYLFFASPATAQSFDIEPANTQLWWHYSYQNRLSENWSFTTASGYRNLWESQVEDDPWDRFHVSSLFSYRKNSRLNFNLGSGLYYTTRPVGSDLVEFRSWQGATVYWPDSPGRFRRFVLSNRFRLAQRFTRQTGTSSWDMNSRARYRMSTAIAINRKELEPGAFYVYLGGEVVADLNDDDFRLVSNRNQFSIGLGWLTTKSWTVEARYSHQNSRDSATSDVDLMARIVELRVSTTLSIRDRMKEH